MDVPGTKRRRESRTCEPSAPVAPVNTCFVMFVEMRDSTSVHTRPHLKAQVTTQVITP